MRHDEELAVLLGRLASLIVAFREAVGRLRLLSDDVRELHAAMVEEVDDV